MSSLEDLLVDEGKVSDEKIADLISPFVEIGNETGKILFREKFYDLDSKNKIIVSLLSIRATHELDLEENFKRKPKQLSEEMSMAEGTVSKLLPRLADKNLVSSDNGEYWIEGVNLNRIERFLKGETSE